MSTRRALCWAFCLSLLLLSACGTEPEKPAPTPTGLQPPNDTPKNTVLRLVAAYEQKKKAEYEALFTGDFTFEFSNVTDPTLATKWSTGWFKSDEVLSATHLFEGGTNLDGQYVVAATSIDLILSKTQPAGDTEGRDTTKYKVLSTPVDLVVEVPPTPPATEPTAYIVTNNSHRFYLVRGDAAVGLTEDQPADGLHWYIWAWRDETFMYLAPRGTAGAAGSRAGRTATVTWGKIKGLYR